MPHDFKRFPELANSQMDFYYWSSPHKQIVADFRAKVVKVHDGDTITLRTNFRDFDFPLRFLDTNAPELSEEKGRDVQQWLESILLNQDVDILIDPKQRVGKWGRLLGTVIHQGIDINQLSIMMGHATTFEARKEGKILSLSEMIPPL